MADKTNTTQTVASVEALTLRVMLTPQQIADREHKPLSYGERVHRQGVAALHLARALALKPQAQIDAAIAAAKKSTKWDDTRVAAAVYLCVYKMQSRSQASKALGTTRNTILSKLNRFGIQGEEVGYNARSGKRVGRKPQGAKSIKKSKTANTADKRTNESAPVSDAAAEAAVAAISASVDQMVLAERATRQRDAGARLVTVARYAPLHQPFAHVNSGFAPAGPLHREDKAVFGVAAHAELPLVALWQGDTGQVTGQWTIMAQTETRPTGDVDSNTMSISAKIVGKSATGKSVYLITAKTKELRNSKGAVIPGSDTPNGKAFVAALGRMGIGGGANALLRQWAVQPNGIGAGGLKFGVPLDPDELPVGLALESEKAAGYLGSYTTAEATLREKVAKLRQPPTARQEASLSRLAAQIDAPKRRLSITEEAAQLAL